MSLPASLTTQLLIADGSNSPIGRIKLAGTILNSTGLSKMRVLGSYALVYLLNGGGEYGDAHGHHQRVQKGDLLWLFPDVGHFYGAPAEGRWDEIYFLFEGPLFEFWRRHNIITPEKPVWHLEPVEFWAARLEEMAHPPATLGWKDVFHQLTRWQGLVSDMLIATSQDENEAGPDWLLKARGLLEEQNSPPGLNEIARNVGLSYESFRKKFSENMGMGPAKYRQSWLVKRACSLLMQRSLSHQEIAERLGFSDEFHFSRVFRRYMGFSPRAFRLKTLGSSLN